MTTEAMEKSYAPSRLLRTELSTLVGFMLRCSIEETLPPPAIFQHLMDRTEALLEELHDCLKQPMVNAISSARLSEKDGEFARGDLLREPIFYGGDSAYIFQYRDLAAERYQRDEIWLQANKGFTIRDATAVAAAISRVQCRKVYETLQSLRAVPKSQWTLFPGFELTLDEVAEEAGIYKELVSAVILALTAPSAPTNGGFNELGDFNIATATPILPLKSGSLVVFEPYSIFEALYDSPFYWMAADRAYRDEAFAHRGDFTEAFVTNRLISVFGEGRVHRGVNMEVKGRRLGEIDVLVVFANRAIIVQCKSKKLTVEARKGNDLRLREDFQKSVQDAYNQALLCARTLHDGSASPELSNGTRLRLPPLQEIYIVCTVADHYPALAWQCLELLKFECTNVILPPLVTDVFLIDVLAEMLPSPLRFLSYLNRRASYGHRVTSSNEHTILSYHLKQNLWVEEGTDMVLLADDIAVDLDTAMTVSREGLPGCATVDGVWNKLKDTLVGRILVSIEHHDDPTLVDIGFRLLTLSGDTISRLSQGIGEITRLTRSDGRQHDFTLGFGTGEGITVHSNDAVDFEVASTLANHCERRKYLSRADGWFGLAVRAYDGMPRLGTHLQYAWKQDDELDRVTSHMHTAGTSGPETNRSRKVGRNEICPCGSGKKHKKCCLRRQSTID